jgi:protein-S-isoprenylcysteine O-methyltransferase Ste14
LNEITFRVLLPSCLLAGVLALVLKRKGVLLKTQREPIRARPFLNTDNPSRFAESVLLVGTVTLAIDVLLRAAWPRELEAVLTFPAFREAAALRWTGFVTMILGLIVYFWGLAGMGTSWRIGIDRDQPGPLVVSGPFARIRHPLYAGILLATLGFVALVPDPLSIAAVSSVWTAVPLQARLEEEFLAARHPEYEEYRARTGRFFPKWAR